MNVAVVSLLGHEGDRCFRGRSLADWTMDAVAGAFPEDNVNGLTDSGIADSDIVAVIGGLYPFVTAQLLRGMREFFEQGDGPCVTVRRFTQPHPAIACELFELLQNVACDRSTLGGGVTLSAAKIGERLVAGKEIVVRLSGSDAEYDVLFDHRFRVRMENGGLVRRLEEEEPFPVSVSRSPEGALVLRAEPPQATFYAIDVLSEEGEMNCELPLVMPSLWSFNARSSLKTNCLTRERIQGRQQYPEISFVEPLVVMGRCCDLQEYREMYESGKVRGYPVDAPYGGTVTDLASLLPRLLQDIRAGYAPGKGMDYFTWRRFAADPSVDLEALCLVEREGGQ